ncbi:M48 family metallopeptidase [Armatimonas rosea]
MVGREDSGDIKTGVAHVRHFTRAMGASYNQVQVSGRKYHWGSCTSSNNLNFDWRIIKALTYVIDYLIVH